jgi:hypothetical protein
VVQASDLGQLDHIAVSGDITARDAAASLLSDR